MQEAQKSPKTPSECENRDRSLMKSVERPSSAISHRSTFLSLLHRHTASTAETEPTLHHHILLPPPFTRLHRLLRRRRYRNHRSEWSGRGRTGRLERRGWIHRRSRLVGNLGHPLDFLLGLLDIIAYRSPSPFSSNVREV